MVKLLSTETLVESPFVIITIGDYTFGNCSKTISNGSMRVTFPNFLESITATKINGEVNTYSITLVYQITLGDDPNLFEKVFSTISNTRKITISYGDWCAPNYIYSNETALIQNIKTRMDFRSSKITYTINCIGDIALLASNKSSFVARDAKPSTVIHDLISNKTSGILDAFPGMNNLSKLQAAGYLTGLDSGDISVKIHAKENISSLNYLNYLVGCMTDSDKSVYKIVYHPASDHPDGEKGGAFFDIKKLTKSNGVLTNNSPDTYSLDIGYPTKNFVMDFNVTTDEQYSILYDYAGDITQQNFVYHIDNNGNVQQNYSNMLTKSSHNMQNSQILSNWWNEMTTFPITADVTLKGLIRPTMLMSYINLDVIFYGQKHIYSGLYVITKETLRVGKEGYSTTLSLLRVGEPNSSGDVGTTRSKM